MRRLGSEETKQIEHDALFALIMCSCDITAQILGLPHEQAIALHETPNMTQLLARDIDRKRFLDRWEDCVSLVVEEADLLEGDEFMIRVRGAFVNGRLETRIDIFSETDFTDE